MTHPIFSYHKTLHIYFITWVVIAFTHWEILYLTTDFTIMDAIADAAVFNGLMMIMGWGLWYPVAYTEAGKGIVMRFLQFFLTGLVWIAIWLFLGDTVLSWVTDLEKYSNYDQSTTMAIRAVIGSLFYVVFVMVYYLFVYQQILQEKTQNETQIKALLRETELNALKAQLNPHFLFNSLNSVSALTISDPDGAREMVNKLSEFLRYSLRLNQHVMVSLSEELSNASRYLDIEKVRFGDKLNCELHLPEECKKLVLPAMLLQPLYENAIKHGVYESMEPVTIRTYCKLENNQLQLSIINSYSTNAARRKGARLGLNNVRERLQKVYGVNNLLQIVKENGYFEVNLSIPQTIKEN
jgi:sensor histidine kinase YesM